MLSIVPYVLTYSIDRWSKFLTQSLSPLISLIKLAINVAYVSLWNRDKTMEGPLFLDALLDLRFPRLKNFAVRGLHLQESATLHAFFKAHSGLTAVDVRVSDRVFVRQQGDRPESFDWSGLLETFKERLRDDSVLLPNLQSASILPDHNFQITAALLIGRRPITRLALDLAKEPDLRRMMESHNTRNPITELWLYNVQRSLNLEVVRHLASCTPAVTHVHVYSNTLAMDLNRDNSGSVTVTYRDDLLNFIKLWPNLASLEISFSPSRKKMYQQSNQKHWLVADTEAFAEFACASGAANNLRTVLVHLVYSPENMPQHWSGSCTATWTRSETGEMQSLETQIASSTEGVNVLAQWPKVWTVE